MATISNRSYVSGNFVLNLAGVQAGFVKSVEGGGVVGDVIKVSSGPDYFSRKHLGSARAEPFTIQAGLSMGTAFYDWIADTWQMTSLRKDGSIVAADHDLQAHSEREFTNALISEVTIPAADGSQQKEPAYFTVKIQPEGVHYRKTTGRVSGDPRGGKSSLWYPANFRLEIDGLDCTRVSRVDAFTVKLELASDEVGEVRDYQTAPRKIDFPNLRIMFSEVSAQGWIDWHESFVVQGNNSEKQEKNGALVFLSSNLATELLCIKFFNLGIFKLTLDVQEGEKIKRAAAELYCERMEFKYGQSKA